MRILVTDGVAEEGVEILRAEAEVDVSPPLKEEELAARIGEYEGLLVRSATRVTARCLARADRLKVIGRAGVGVDNIDLEAATRKGIVVLNAPGGNAVAVAEHTLALLLALARNLPQAHQHVKSGKWERSKFLGSELRGKTLGLFGLGRIGSEVARRALALGMTVLAYDPAVAPERAAVLGVTPAEPAEILATADYVSLHLPLTPETHGFIGERELDLMKPGVRLINCARGGVIDELALARAVREGRVAGAALDVFAQEPPPPDHPLLALENVIVTPHLGASTAEAQVNVAVETARAMLAVLQGQLVASAVNVPAPGPEDTRRLAPFLPLAEALGCFARQWAEGMIQSVRLTCAGEIAGWDTRPLVSAVLKGMLRPVLYGEVNAVNAPLLARERGIKVSETKTLDTEGFASELAVTVATNREEKTVAGALSARGEPRLVRLDEYRLDMAPAEHMLVCPHIDQPGIIGQVGSILGGKGVNISGMQVARHQQGGRAMMVLGMDSAAPPEALEQISRVQGILSVRPVHLSLAR